MIDLNAPSDELKSMWQTYLIDIDNKYKELGFSRFENKIHGIEIAPPVVGSTKDTLRTLHNLQDMVDWFAESAPKQTEKR